MSLKNKMSNKFCILYSDYSNQEWKKKNSKISCRQWLGKIPCTKTNYMIVCKHNSENGHKKRDCGTVNLI